MNTQAMMPDFRATDISPNNGGAEFRVFFRGRNLGPFRLAVPGIHNVSNALVGDRDRHGIGYPRRSDPQRPWPPLPVWSGVFICAEKQGGIMVVDDYGHHPTEVQATLAAAKQGWRPARWWCYFSRIATAGSRDLIAGIFPCLSIRRMHCL